MYTQLLLLSPVERMHAGAIVFGAVCVDRWIMNFYLFWSTTNSLSVFVFFLFRGICGRPLSNGIRGCADAGADCSLHFDWTGIPGISCLDRHSKSNELIIDCCVGHCRYCWWRHRGDPTIGLCRVAVWSRMKIPQRRLNAKCWRRPVLSDDWADVWACLR